MQPRMLVLDEPMVGMGPQESERMIEILQALRGQVTILLVEHDMDAVFALADRISVLVNRLRTTADPAAVRADPAVRAASSGRRVMLKVESLDAGYWGCAGALWRQLPDQRWRGGDAPSGATAWARPRPSAPSWASTHQGAERCISRARASNGSPPHEIARRGIGLAPEAADLRVRLSVEENLVATAANRTKASEPWTLACVFALFPRLEERRAESAGTLSGGEQQMLAIGRALMTNPRLLILDEAHRGARAADPAGHLELLSALRAQGLSILVVDRNLDALMALADAP
jgi:ABC-type branched-subunit amino acid transport system ATPase component